MKIKAETFNGREEAYCSDCDFESRRTIAGSSELLIKKVREHIDETGHFASIIKVTETIYKPDMEKPK